MPLHLIKLCVGAETVADLQDWVRTRMATAGRHVHTTRMRPKRRDEILDGGSLYWVIKGEVICRQRILDLCAVTDPDGIARCDIVLDPNVVCVDPRPRGPFQGWRYLLAQDAPPDMASLATQSDLPPGIQRDLRMIGVL